MPEQQYDLINQFLRGAINRRTFIRKAVGLGLAAPVVVSIAAMRLRVCPPINENRPPANATLLDTATAATALLAFGSQP